MSLNVKYWDWAPRSSNVRNCCDSWHLGPASQHSQHFLSPINFTCSRDSQYVPIKNKLEDAAWFSVQIKEIFNNYWILVHHFKILSMDLKQVVSTWNSDKSNPFYSLNLVFWCGTDVKIEDTDSSEQPEELLASVGADSRPSSAPQCGVRLASPRPCPHSVHISISAPSPEPGTECCNYFYADN